MRAADIAVQTLVHEPAARAPGRQLRPPASEEYGAGQSTADRDPPVLASPVLASPVLTAPISPATGFARVRELIAALITLVRPGQWPKNVLVVPVALLSAPVWTVDILVQVGWSVLAFTLASAVVYVVNDIADRERDSRHPVKRIRPVASGVVPVAVARLVAATLVTLLGGLLISQSPAMFWPVAAYLALNVAYSMRLKHVPLVDVFTIAAGFVLRVIQGYCATGFPVSPWLLLCVFSTCVLLGLGKRRHELMVAGKGHRPALRGYSVHLVDHLIVLNAAVTVTACLLFLDSDALLAPSRQPAILLAVPFVLFGLARYLQVVLVHQQGGNPVRLLLRDPVMVTNVLLCAAVVGACLVVAHYPNLMPEVT